MEHREAITETALLLSKEEGGVVLKFATGVGKSLIAIKCFEQYFAEKGADGYLIIKQIDHEENWRREFIKWGKEHLLDHITFFCYASLHKYEDTETGFLILDEVHALSEGREGKLEKIKWEKGLALSATIPKEVATRLKELGFKSTYTVSLQDAIDFDILPPPEIYVNYIELDDVEKLYVWSKKDLKLLTQKEYYKRISKRVVYWQNQYMRSGEAWQERKWLFSALERKKFMTSCKTKRAGEIIQYLKGKRFVCFTGGIEQCKKLGVSQAIHSKIHKKERAIILQDFNELKTNELYAVGMLREAMNLEGIEAGLIVQLDNQQGSFTQMAGRTMRAIAPEIYILLCRDTKDEDYFEKATKGINPQYIKEFILPQQ